MLHKNDHAALGLYASLFAQAAEKMVTLIGHENACAAD
jgi:hypothetical protein